MGGEQSVVNFLFVWCLVLKLLFKIYLKLLLNLLFKIIFFFRDNKKKLLKIPVVYISAPNAYHL